MIIAGVATWWRRWSRPTKEMGEAGQRLFQLYGPWYMFRLRLEIALVMYFYNRKAPKLLVNCWAWVFFPIRGGLPAFGWWLFDTYRYWRVVLRACCGVRLPRWRR